jgi:hypothetical protein
MEDPESVRIILGIAESYDRLADRAERSENPALLKSGISTVSMAA